MTSEVSKCSKIQIFRGCAPDPAGVAYSASPESLASGEGAVGRELAAPSPRTLPPLSAVRASSFGPLGLACTSLWV